MSDRIPLTILLYGDTGSGKSPLAISGPGPRLVIDAESAAHHAHRVVNGEIEIAEIERWRPGDPVPKDPKDTVIYSVTAVEDLRLITEVLRSGEHPFKSIVVDSISEVQNIIRETLEKKGMMPDGAWTRLWADLTSFIRAVRNTVVSDKQPVDVVVFVALPKYDQAGLKTVQLQGRSATDVPSMVDIVAHVELAYFPEEDDYHQQILLQRSSSPPITARTRSPLVRQALGRAVVDHTLADLYNIVNGIKESS